VILRKKHDTTTTTIVWRLVILWEGTRKYTATSLSLCKAAAEVEPATTFMGLGDVADAVHVVADQVGVGGASNALWNLIPGPHMTTK